MLTDLYAYLITASTAGLDSDRAAAIGSLRTAISTRLSVDILREGSTLPALVYQLIDANTDHVLTGEPCGLIEARVQFDIYVDIATGGPVARESLGAYLKIALDGFEGMMGGTAVNVILWDNEVDMYESDRMQYRKMLDFRVLYN